MEGVRLRTPLLLESPALCLSLFYFLTTFPISIYLHLSRPGCLLWPPPPPPRLFDYPPSYGERKHSLPTPLRRCSSPVHFPDYSDAVKEVEELIRRNMTTAASRALRYQVGRRETFAGNLSMTDRLAFFSGSGDIPCGFFTDFPISDADRSAMESCDGVVIASAVFGDHDKIRQPEGLGSQTLAAACFFMFIDDTTSTVLASHGISGPQIGAWHVVRLNTSSLPYRSPAMNGVIVKHLLHRLFPNAKLSVWVDGKLQLAADPLLLIHALLISPGADIAISKHPFNRHAMEEAVATARWRKVADVEAVRQQMEAYCANGMQPWSPAKLPEHASDVPDTALIIRRHGPAVDRFGCLLFNELEAFGPRDQLAFGFVRDKMRPELRVNMFDAEVFEHVAVEYRHNVKRGGDGGSGITSMAELVDINGSSCRDYLLKMWGEET